MKKRVPLRISPRRNRQQDIDMIFLRHSMSCFFLAMLIFTFAACVSEGKLTRSGQQSLLEARQRRFQRVYPLEHRGKDTQRLSFRGLNQASQTTREHRSLHQAKSECLISQRTAVYLAMFLGLPAERFYLGYHVLGVGLDLIDAFSTGFILSHATCSCCLRILLTLLPQACALSLYLSVLVCSIFACCMSGKKKAKTPCNRCCRILSIVSSITFACGIVAWSIYDVYALYEGHLLPQNLACRFVDRV